MTILALDNVCKSYGEGAARTSVLKDINLQIEDGDFIAIVGFSGSGKTPLISTIAGLVTPPASAFRIAGLSAATISSTRRSGFTW